MTSRVKSRARFWAIFALTALGITTAVSFVRAQVPPPNGPAVPANTVTFGSGAGVPVRGTPFNQRNAGFAYGLPGPPWFGAWMRPTQVMPGAPVLPKGFGQGVTPTFFNPSASAGGQQTAGALGSGGQAQGGGQQQGQQGGGIGGIGGGNAGGGGQLGGGGISGGQQSLVAQGQNFQNPTGNLGFIQLPNPQGYIGGFTGGQITGSGVIGGGQQGQQGGQQGQQGGFGGGQGGGFGGGGFGGGGVGGKGAGFAGANGS